MAAVHTLITKQALWKSGYYRSFESPTGFRSSISGIKTRRTMTPHSKSMTLQGVPTGIREHTHALADTHPPCVRVYSDSQANYYFAVAFGQCFGQDWIHFACTSASDGHSWEDYAGEE